MSSTASSAGGSLRPAPRLGYQALDAMESERTRDLFAHSGYLPLPGLLGPEALTDLLIEVDGLLEAARRRDFDMECMGGSPRHMTTLGGVEISRLAPRITEVYRSPDLVERLGRLVGLDLVLADDPVPEVRFQLQCHGRIVPHHLADRDTGPSRDDLTDELAIDGHGDEWILALERFELGV